MASKEGEGAGGTSGAYSPTVPPLPSVKNEMNNSSAMLLGEGEYTANTTDQSVSSPHGSSTSVSLKGSSGKPPRVPRVPVGDFVAARKEGQDSGRLKRPESARLDVSGNESGTMGSVAPPLKLGFARLRRSSSSLEVEHVKKYESVIRGKAVVDLNVAVGDVALGWSSSMKARAGSMWSAMKSAAGKNKVQDISSEYTEKQINAVVRIQRAMRMYWYKESMKKWKADNSITFKRSQLLARLRGMANAQEVPVSFLPYMVLVIVIMVTLLYDQSPAEQNALVGTTVHSVLGRDGVGRVPRTFQDFYGMMKDVVGHVELKPGDDPDELGFYYNYVMILGWYITMVRGKAVPCTETPGLPNYYNNRCLVAFDPNDPETAPFGNTTVDALSYKDAIYGLSDNSQYIRSSDSTENSTLLCPQFTSSRTEGIATYGQDSYVIELPHDVVAANSSAPLWIVEMLERCEFLHPQTKQVLFELYGWVNTNTPLLSVVIFIMSVDDYGQARVEFRAASSHLQPVWEVDGASGGVLKVCFILLAVFSVFGLVGTGFYLTVNLAQGGCAFASMALLEGFTYVNILQYLSIWAYLLAHLMRQYALDGMINSNFSNFEENGQILIEAEEALRILKAVLMSCTILKMMQYVRFRGQLSILVAVLRRVFWTLLHFTGVFVIVLIACALFGWGAFSNAVYSWNSVGDAMNTVLLMTFGDFDYEEMEQVQTYAAIIVTILTLTMLSTILMNFFIAIILEGYASVSSERRFKMTIKDEVYSGLVRIIEVGGAKHNIEELMWVLSRTSFLGKFEYVTLFDIRSMLRYDMPQEFMTILLDMRDGKDADRIYAGPYTRVNQHKKVKVFLGSQFVYPILLGCLRSYDLFIWCDFMKKRLLLYRRLLQGKQANQTRGVQAGIYNVKKLKARVHEGGKERQEISASSTTQTAGTSTDETKPMGDHESKTDESTPRLSESESFKEGLVSGSGPVAREVPPYLTALAEKVRRLEAMLEATDSSDNGREDAADERSEDAVGNTLTKAPPIMKVSLSLPSVAPAPVKQNNSESSVAGEQGNKEVGDENGDENMPDVQASGDSKNDESPFYKDG